MRTFKLLTAFFILLLAANISCEKLLAPRGPEDDEVLDGTVEGLTADQNLQFIRGDIAFNDEVFTKENGLGPVFVATSCGSCHAGDGKGHPFTTLTRFGQTGAAGNQFLHMGGPQLQNRALPGFPPEEIPAGATFSSFTPPANTGLGFIDVIPDAAILALADPNDANGDGISGVPNWIKPDDYTTLRPGSIPNGERYIGRFGKKGATYDLLQQTANAYNQDIGVTSSFEPNDPFSGHGVDGEVSDQTVIDVVFYLKTLKAPQQRIPGDPEVVAGRQLFMNINCGKCHTPEFKTGPSEIAPLANKTIHPYSDLLLHDMGPGLNDGYTEGSAAPAEWRTPLLWGLGLSKNSQGRKYFLLHDGRARSIEEAIMLHGGEAQRSRDLFAQLGETEKKQLIKFLESL